MLVQNPFAAEAENLRQRREAVARRREALLAGVAVAEALAEEAKRALRDARRTLRRYAERLAATTAERDLLDEEEARLDARIRAWAQVEVSKAGGQR